MFEQSRFDAVVAEAGLAGAVGLVTRGQESVCLATGLASIAEQIPMQTNAIFQIASMTKALTSVAALQLVEQGLLSLDAPLGDMLSDLDALPVLEGYDGDEPAFARQPRGSPCANCLPIPPVLAISLQMKRCCGTIRPTRLRPIRALH